MPRDRSNPAARPPAGHALIVATLAAGLFLSLAAVLRWQQDRVVAATAIAHQLDESGNLRPAAEVASLVRAMKLVTVQIDTTVAAKRTDESWRGNVEATVRAPARLLYGTDLSNLADGAVRASPLLNSYILRVPRPYRIATEIFPERDEPEVTTGWLRLRSRAGEYYLGQARRSLAEEARRVVLNPEDAELVEEATRDQITQLVRALVGDHMAVTVLFEDEGVK